MKSQKRMFYCTLCDYNTKNSHRIKDHMAKHTGLDYYKCLACDQTFMKHHRLVTHINVNHPEYQRQPTTSQTFTPGAACIF